MPKAQQFVFKVEHLYFNSTLLFLNCEENLHTVTSLGQQMSVPSRRKAYWMLAVLCCIPKSLFPLLGAL
jgi:hypothetical protein